MTNPRFWVQEKSPRTGDEWKEIYTTDNREDAGLYMINCCIAPAIRDRTIATPIAFRIVDERGEEV